MASDSLLLPDLWAKTVSLVKDRVNNRSMWEALEQSKAIIIDNDTLIIGLPPSLAHLSSHLVTADHLNTIQQCASSVAQCTLSVRVIEGDTIADWISTQKREERVAAMRNASYQRHQRVSEAAQNWDAVYEYAARAYSSLALRQLPQSKSRYLTDMLYVLSDAVNQLMPTPGDETQERLLARVIDRVATNAEVPSTVVALELERLRTWQQSQPTE